MTDSTPTMTHERAAAVRLASDPTAHFDTSFRLGLITSSDVATAAATQLGREALAKYDAEWVTIRREHLMALTKTYRNMLIPTIKLAQAIAHANEVLEGK